VLAIEITRVNQIDRQNRFVQANEKDIEGTMVEGEGGEISKVKFGVLCDCSPSLGTSVSVTGGTTNPNLERAQDRTINSRSIISTISRPARSMTYFRLANCAAVAREGGSLLIMDAPFGLSWVNWYSERRFDIARRSADDATGEFGGVI